MLFGYILIKKKSYHTICCVNLSHGVKTSPLAQKDSTKLTIFWLILIAQEMLFSTIPNLLKLVKPLRS